MFTPYARHTSPETRNAIRDAVAADMAREPRVITVPVTPSTVAAMVFLGASALVGLVESLPL